MDNMDAVREDTSQRSSEVEGVVIISMKNPTFIISIVE
jgi:hypothetical protein